MIAGLAWMLPANASLLLAAHALLRRLRTDAPAVNGLLFVLLHLLLMSCGVLLAGTTGGLTPGILGIGGSILLAILLLLGEHRHLRLPPRPEMGRATAVLAALLAVRMAVQVWFFAPHGGDALAYHLPKVAEWIRAGAFTREMGMDRCASFPAGFELIEAWWVVFLHHDVLIELAGVEYALLAFLALRALALNLGLSDRTSCFAATLYVLTPMFSLQTTSCMNDAAVAALVLALAALVAERAHPALVLIPLGLIWGTKGTGLFTLPGWVLLAAWRRGQPFLRPASVRVAAAAGVVSLVGAGFWLLRNWLWYGHPLFPVHGDNPAFVDLVQKGPRLESLGKNTLSFVSSLIYDADRPLTPISERTAGWGAIGFSVGVVALIQRMREEVAFRRMGAAFGLSMLSVFLMVQPDPWNARFVLFAPAILCIAAARFLETVRPAAVVLGIGIVLEFAVSILPGGLPRADLLVMLKQPWRERSAHALPQAVPPGAPIGVFTPSLARTNTYSLYGSDLSHEVVYLRLYSVGELEAEMRRRKLEFVRVTVKSRQRFEFLDLVARGRFRAIGEDLYHLE
jgi:hypothetical protein